MSKNNLLKDKRKLILVFVALISVTVGYITYDNSSSKKIAANNADASEQLIPDETIDLQQDDTSDTGKEKVQVQNVRSFDKYTLIHDNRGVPVLYYHSINNTVKNELTTTPEKLRTELEYIKDQGYVTITIDELKNYILNNSPIPEKSIVITFDDGYMDNYNNAFPILKEFDMVATIFSIGSELDGSYYLSKEAIKEMSDYGIDIESHTVHHVKLDEMTYDQQLKELQDSKKILESITGKEVSSIAYPFGNFNEDSIKAAKAAGYTLGFTTNRGLSDMDDNPLKLDRIYVSSEYDMNTFKEILAKTKK
jgi:peptidoglycan/xylan/chitin deacetylase (PgdA/CDA1 family)